MDNWYSLAKGLPLNGHIRVTCCSNKNTTAIISHSSKGYRFHCFRCGDTAWKPKGPMTLHELYSTQQQAAESSFKESGVLPLDACKDFPDAERIWLAEGGVTRPELHDGRYWYSPSMQRILLPVHAGWEHDVPSGYQARSCHVKPKYITSGYAPYHTQSPIYKVNRTSLCITEDILSCNKVGQFCESLALIGTHLTDAAIGAIIQSPRKFKRIYVWLDPDEAGQSASRKIALRLRTLNLALRVIEIHSDKDPKKTPRDEIRRLLEH